MLNYYYSLRNRSSETTSVGAKDTQQAGDPRIPESGERESPVLESHVAQSPAWNKFSIKMAKIYLLMTISSALSRTLKHF